MGEDVLQPRLPWQVYDELRADPRAVFLPERVGFSEYWRRTGDLISGGPNAWTGSYLAASASDTECTVVTFDRGFKAISNCGVLTLSA